MSPAKEAWAGELGGGRRGLITNPLELLLLKKTRKKTLTFLFSNIDEQSTQSYALDRISEEEDDAYNFSTDYV